MRRSLDLFGPDHTLMQYGIRSGTREEFQFMNRQKTLFKSRETFFEAVQNLPDKRPIYLTLDLDYFDPAFMPGTGTPEAGGEDFLSLVAFLNLVENKNLVGADIVELSPPIDTTGNSDSFASKVAREVLLSLNAHVKGR
jgi:agmatinase